MMENDRVVAMSIHIQSCCALGFGLIVGAQYSADRTSEFETHFFWLSGARYKNFRDRSRGVPAGI
jgi:hypothetical protein